MTHRQNFWLLTLIHNQQTFYQASVDIFGFIFLYQLFQHDLLVTCTIFALGYLFQVLATPFSMKAIGHVGTRAGLMIAVALHIVALFPVYWYANNQQAIMFLYWFAIIKCAHVFYFPTRIYLTGKYTSHDGRGGEIAIKEITALVTASITPLVAGFIIQEFGYHILIACATVIMAAITLPAALMKNAHFKFKFKTPQWNTNATYTLWKANLIAAVDQQAARKLWTLFIFLSVAASYEILGFVLAGATATSALLVYIIGKLLDKHDRLHILSQLYNLSAVTHVLKIFTFIPLYLNDTIDRFARGLENEASNVENYDLMTDHIAQTRRDEMVVIREMSVNAANALSMMLAGVLGSYVGFGSLFVIFAVVMVLLNYAFFGGRHFRTANHGRVI